MQRTRQARRLGYGVAALIAIAAITLVLQAGPEGVSSVEIRTTSYGVPHVRAADFGGRGTALDTRLPNRTSAQSRNAG